ncbi:MAG: type II toxin-antitoxin system RelE/ParE family toxin, partial [Campylobacterota bacterium]
MQIFRTRLYKTQLLRILKHIAKDKISASEKFHTDLEKQINNLTHSPYKCRQSFYSDDENVRDMVFMKYTIQYKIYENKISILKIFNKNKPKEDRYNKT